MIGDYNELLVTTMIDRTARTQYSQILRQFASGRTTNDTYEEQYSQSCEQSDDKVIFTVYFAFWLLYDDLRTHKMIGRHRLSRHNRRTLARCILFLQNDAEYYDLLPPPGCAARLLSLLTLGVWKDSNHQERRQHKENIWPFATVEDLDAARRHPKLLCGNKC